jgi:hypothetical protein
MSLASTWTWVENTGPAVAMRESVWLYPAVETLHILGLAALVGAIVLLDLRLLGASRSLSLDGLARHALPLVYAAFGVQVVTGALLFMSDATAIAANSAFRLKLVLIAAAVANALAFNLGSFRHSRAARLFAGASIGLWVGVVICGRLIAYV